jgi:outer membrane scaffolding protein for murein synthesis (MipA/OmpV family)
MAVSVTGNAHENTYRKGYLTDETKSLQFNMGTVFSILNKKLDIAPIIGMSYFANPYSNKYYGETVYDKSVINNKQHNESS